MKKTMLFALVALSAVSSAWAAAEKLIDGFVNKEVVTLGEWNYNYTAVRKFADDHNIPILMFYGMDSCGKCNSMIRDGLNSSVFRNWLKDHPICLVFQDKKSTAMQTDDAKRFVKTEGDAQPSTDLPYMKIYWKNKDGKKLYKAFTGRLNQMPSKTGATLGQQLVNSLELVLADYFKAKTPAAFAVGDTPGDRLEAEIDETKSVVVPLKRDDVSKIVTVPYTVKSGTKTLKSGEVTFAKGEATQSFTVAIPEEKFADGDQLTLVIGKDDATATSHITFVQKENSPKNPRWIGERDASTLKPGEWTMDYELTKKQAKSKGSYTLALVAGSLWCPDCVNADAYLIDTDAFKNWATENQVFCATIDVPAFPANKNTCLLTREASEVSTRYINATVPPQDKIQSGAGYLSRHEISDADAAEALARNLNLVTNVIANSGLCRPEQLADNNPETGAWKTGVPGFIVLDENARILGRLYQFSNVSPTDTSAAEAYVQRLDEIIALKNDPTEELNRDWSTATTADCELSMADGATKTSTISAIDTIDYWKLGKREKWVSADFTVVGKTGATGENNVKLELWRVEGNKATMVEGKTGNLKSGVKISNLGVPASGDYYLKLSALDTSEAFKLEHEGDSTVEYTITVAARENAGTLAFEPISAKATEDEAKRAGGTLRVYATLKRNGGATGEKEVAIKVVEELTTAIEDRYELVTKSVTWADGEMGAKSVAIDVFDDANADGTQLLTICADDPATAVFALEIVDNDKTNPGKLALRAINPTTAKKGTVIAIEGTTITLAVERYAGASGYAGCTLSTTAGSFGQTQAFGWESREGGPKTIDLNLPTLAEYPSGKVTVSLANKIGAALDTAAKSLTVELISQDAPQFQTATEKLSCVRYLAVDEEVEILNLGTATAKVTKLSGSIPAGIKVAVADGKLKITGVPTGTGRYSATYQISKTEKRVTTKGATIGLEFEIVDVSTLDPADPGANPAVKKSRTFGDMAVIDESKQRLVGILSGLTIPPTGKASAKFKCAEGTISLSATGWSAYSSDDGTLSAQLVVAKKAYKLALDAKRDGSVEIKLSDPAGNEFTASAMENGWSKKNPATAWKGTYTAAVRNAILPEGVEDFAFAMGNPIITFKLTTSTALNKGLVSYSGTLPNGQTFSGSATLSMVYPTLAELPIYYRSTKEFFTAMPQIKANHVNKAVESNESVLPYWRHTESTSKAACYELYYLLINGSYYNSAIDFTKTIDPTKSGHILATPIDALEIATKIEKSKVTLDKAEAKAVSATATVTKSTGIVSGRFKTTTEAGKAVTASYKMVILPDWDDGCPDCGGVEWASGACWFTDKLTLDSKAVSVKCGDVMMIEAVESVE